MCIRDSTGPAKTDVGVLIIEDLHWIDPGSEEFLSRLLGLLPASRTLVIVNFRTGYEADWTRGSNFRRLTPVSYTHLDVYKRQRVLSAEC